MTIEERARDYARHVSIEELQNEGLDAESFCGILHGYIRGARDQKELDVNKACSIFCRFCTIQCEGHPHEDCQILKEFSNALLNYD